MALSRVLFAITVAALLAACVDDGPSVDYPVCPNPGEFVLEGELDGRAVTVSRAYSGFLFANALGGTGTLEIDADADGSAGSPKILVNFNKLIGYGEETAASGTVELTGDDVVAGNCEGTGLSGRIFQSDDGSSYGFVLRDLRASPFCGGAAIAGELRGCIQTEDF